MAATYKTVLNKAETENIIEKSRFIGYIKPVESAEEAEGFITEIKKLNKDATHNVPVYVIGEKFEVQRYSDDGEPSGTAGVPILQMLIKEGITNVAVIITRYFGGIKLGTGGLFRAYTNTAKMALEEAQIALVSEYDVIDVKIDYTFLGKLQNLSLTENFTIRDTLFEDTVTLTIVSSADKTAKMKETLINITNGTCRLINQRKEMLKMAIGEV